MNFGESVLHEIIYYHKNEHNVFFVVLRSDNTIYFHNALKPEFSCFMPLPEYQNNMFLNAK